MRLLRKLWTSLFKNSTNTKKHETLTSKQKKTLLKIYIRGKKSLIRLFVFLCFCLGVFVPFGAFGTFGACKIFL